jgi:hypothetical protein
MADEQERRCWQEHEEIQLRGRSASTRTFRPQDLTGNDCRHQQRPPGDRTDEDSVDEQPGRDDRQEQTGWNDREKQRGRNDRDEQPGRDDREKQRGAGS